MDFGFAKGIAAFLGFLAFRQLQGAAHGQFQTRPPIPPAPTFAGYDLGEKLVVDLIEDPQAQEFLYFNKQVSVVSSNVAWIQYWIEDQKLNVGFLNTYVYEYFDITVELAYDFFTTVSKGKWVWDNLRTTRRAYLFLYSLNGRTPVRMEDPAATSVKAALGSLSILGSDPFSQTKSAKRVKARFAFITQLEKTTPRFARQKNYSYQFLAPKRKRLGLKGIRKIIRGTP